MRTKLKDDKIKSVLTEREYLSYLEFKKVKVKWKMIPGENDAWGRYNGEALRRTPKNIYKHYKDILGHVYIEYLDGNAERSTKCLGIAENINFHLKVKLFKKWDHNKALLINDTRKEEQVWK